MSERYSRLFTLPERLYAEGAPVVIMAGALLKDNQTGGVLAQLRIRNLDEKALRALKVQLHALDTAGRSIGDPVVFQYLDLTAKCGEDFGAQTPIRFDDSSVRAFSVTVQETVFEDHSIWSATDAAWEQLSLPQPLAETLPDAEMQKQFKIAYGKDSNNVYTAEKDLWYCVCGALNKKSVPKCRCCGREASVLSAWDRQALEAAKEARLAEDQAAREEAAREAERKADERRIAAERKAEERRIAAEQAAKKRKKILKIAAPIVAACIAFVILLTSVIIPNSQYNALLAKLEAGEYDAAELAIGFGKLRVKDAKERSFALWDKVAARNTIAAGSAHTVGLKSDGTVVEVGSNNDGECNVSGWTDIVSIAAAWSHTVGLKADGTVVAAGYNDDGRCDVSGWTDIVAISAGVFHTVGLKSDGTVVATKFTGDQEYYYGQCDVTDWTDIVAIAAGRSHTVGLKTDGTVVATEFKYKGDYYAGQFEASAWTDIVAIAAGGYHTVGLKTDGTVVAAGENGDGQCHVSGWTDIVAISAGGWHTVGLKSDGTVVAVGWNGHGQCDVSGWTDIVAIAAGYSHTVGLKADGTVVATKYTGEQKYNYGQCDVSGWRNIKLPTRSTSN